MSEQKREQLQLPSRLSFREDIKAFQAKTIQERYASNDYWHKMRLIHENLGKELKRRRWVQGLARSEKNPFKFCETIKAQANWFTIPKVKWPASFSHLSLRAYKRMIRLAPDTLIHPEIFSPERFTRIASSPEKIKGFSRTVRQLGARRPGASRLEIHEMAYRLVASPKFRGRNRAHRLCVELQRLAKLDQLDVPEDDPIRRYSDLPRLERREQCNRIRSGQDRRTRRKST